MPLVSSKDMLLKAAREGYAVGAFNIENMEIAQAVIEGAVEMNAPVMIQTTSGTLQYAPPEVFYGMVKALADRVSVPIALHLDHGSGLELVQRCRDAGYTSLMIDGSKLPFEDNVDITRKAVTMAEDIPVEAELGTVGGKEDGMEGGIQYTDPAKAAEFVQRTGLSSLAVAIGTAHGVYKGEPRLNIDLLASIHAATPVPLVLHGSSGVPDAQIGACIANGISKVNYATDLRIAYTDAVRAWLAGNSGFDPKGYGKAAREAVRAVVRDRIALTGSKGKA